MNKMLENQTEEFKKVFEMLNVELFAEGLKIRKKSDLLTFFVKKGFTITIRNGIHIDPKKELGIGTLFHEAMHYIDQCKYDPNDGLFHKSLWGSIKFYVKYTFPQNLLFFVLFALLAIPFSNYFLFFLLGFVGLIPTPILTKARANYELRGYFWSWLIDERKHFMNTFGGSTYYYMDKRHSDLFYNKVFEGYRVLIEHGRYQTMGKLYSKYLKLKI